MIANLKRFRKRPFKNLSNFRQRRSKFPHLFFGLILLLMLGFLAVSNWKIYKKRTDFNSGIGILSKKLQELESLNQELKEKISAIPEENYLEKVAREKFNLKKPGEEVVVIKKEKEASTSVEIEEKKNFFNPQDWLNWIKNKFRRE